MSLSSPIPAVGAALMVALATSPARASSGGFAAQGCAGCHNGGAKPSVSMKLMTGSPAPGETLTFDVAIDAVNGNTGGLYVLTDGRGKLVSVSGQGTKLLSESQLVHSAPKQASGGAVHFTVKWIAPDTPGGLVIRAWGISANGDGKSKGDGGGATITSLVYGCEGSTYYIDKDGDGYGDSNQQVTDCSQLPSYAEKGGDCDDISNVVHPDAAELCNDRDDNCDGQVDENVEVGPQYKDDDGDGHGAMNGDVVMAKCPPFGYAPTRDDCDDTNAEVYEGATETCNYIDDDCDQRVDEDVREVCGVGWCARLAFTCDSPVICTPGDPIPEVCNLLDDDCDGETDEGEEACGAGNVCKDGACVPGSAVADSGDASAGASCAVDSQPAPLWGALVLLSPLAAVWRRWRRTRRAGALEPGGRSSRR